MSNEPYEALMNAVGRLYAMAHRLKEDRKWSGQMQGDGGNGSSWIEEEITALALDLDPTGKLGHVLNPRVLKVVERLKEIRELDEAGFEIGKKLDALIADLEDSKIRFDHSYTIGIDKDGYLRTEEVEP
jgi:hypothetical protein